ncbi:DUF262 domain-containing protein [Methylobacterium sp. Leaf89]|uniref:DUF262 domain-containing protein n=1 Tax=Methylobacterium sp. Leaf89 TaxID=1736245 RepID=UPI000A4DCFCC|nr:DUF262 domain-containing protein [Methylobacterium sp. Leaf89]
MEATPARVIQYFHGEKQSLIPLFQRPYSWRKSNWETLWNDIIVQYDSDDAQSHFMGAIVSVPAKSVPVGVSKHLIIDGQQRLTTVAIILCALRDIVEKNTSDRIHEVYLVNKFRDPEDTLKFVPTQLDRETFNLLVLQRQPPENDSLMSQAYGYFKNQLLSGVDGNGDPIDPQKILTTMEHSLQVVMINIGESDDPYLIFESLNFKGQPLTQADLVRNYLLMRFKHAITAGGEQERIHKYFWMPIQESLGDKITEFLRHYAMKDGDNINQGGIYVAIKQKFKDIEGPELVEAKISEMRLFAAYYASMLNPSLEANVTIRQSLQKIGELEITTSYPLMLQLISAQKSGHLSVEDLCDCISIIESFVVRRSVCGVPTNALNKLFLGWCKAFPRVEHKQWLYGVMSSGNGGRRYPGDEEFGEAFKNQPQYGRGSTRFILVRLERHYGHKEPADLTGATIEHILPQTLTPAWEEMLGPDALLQHDKLKDRFGNLSLTAYNSELGNLSFEDKKERLKDTHIGLNKWIVSRAFWTEQEITLRGENLFKSAMTLWQGPAGSA